MGNDLHLDLTPGQTADCGRLPDPLAALPQVLGAVVADKAYDTDKSLETIAGLGTEAVIPPQASHLDQRPYDENRYADRSEVERFFGRLKEARALATHYDKTACSFLAVAHLLAALDWLR